MEPTTEEADRRVWVRYPAELETTYQKPGQAERGRLSAKVRDISRGGVNLLVQHSFQPGDMLSVELPAPEGRARTWESRFTLASAAEHCPRT